MYIVKKTQGALSDFEVDRPDLGTVAGFLRVADDAEGRVAERERVGAVLDAAEEEEPKKETNDRLFRNEFPQFLFSVVENSGSEDERFKNHGKRVRFERGRGV